MGFCGIYAWPKRNKQNITKGGAGARFVGPKGFARGAGPNALQRFVVRVRVYFAQNRVCVFGTAPLPFFFIVLFILLKQWLLMSSTLQLPERRPLSSLYLLPAIQA